MAATRDSGAGSLDLVRLRAEAGSQAITWAGSTNVVITRPGDLAGAWSRSPDTNGDGAARRSSRCSASRRTGPTRGAGVLRKLGVVVFDEVGRRPLADPSAGGIGTMATGTTVHQ